VNLSECSSPAVIDEILKAWPNVAKTAALTMIQKYGPPDEACSGRLVWHNNGPWRRTVVYAEEVEHNFPTPHHDVLEQYIPYRVPVGKFDQLAAFDGSVLVDRTKGEISARCEGEGGNLLALNLANDIVHGRKDVATARKEYGEAMKAKQRGNPPEIMQRLMFEVGKCETGEPDVTII
jgi:hypothetical protein